MRKLKQDIDRTERPKSPCVARDIERRWRCEVPSRYRLAYQADLDPKRGSITEVRLEAGRITRDDWARGGREEDIFAVRYKLTLSPIKMHVQTVCSYSLHALGRRYQRGRDCDDASILRDIRLGVLVDPDKVPEDEGVIVRTDSEGGGWRAG